MSTNNIQSEIAADLRAAKYSIKVAVSWLTDQLLIQELLAACRRYVKVQIIVSADRINILRFELFRAIIEAGGVVRKVGSQQAQAGNFMHFKFFIIDDKMSKAGSYNWTLNAMLNYETLDKVPVERKLAEFHECFKNSVDFFDDIDDPDNAIKSLESDFVGDLSPQKLLAYKATQAELKRHGHAGKMNPWLKTVSASSPASHHHQSTDETDGNHKSVSGWRDGAFQQVGAPHVTEITPADLVYVPEKDHYELTIDLEGGRHIVTPKLARGVSPNLQMYDLALFVSTRDITLRDGTVLKKGYQVWRLIPG